MSKTNRPAIKDISGTEIAGMSWRLTIERTFPLNLFWWNIIRYNLLSIARSQLTHLPGWESFLKWRKWFLGSEIQDTDSHSILEARDKNAWNKARGARLLRIDRVTLYRKIKRFNLAKDTHWCWSVASDTEIMQLACCMQHFFCSSPIL
jgi:hypothetical protein